MCLLIYFYTHHLATAEVIVLVKMVPVASLGQDIKHLMALQFIHQSRKVWECYTESTWV